MVIIMDNELEKLQIKCKAYEKEIEFLRINIKTLENEKEALINSRSYQLIRKIRKLVWWKK